jgi:hypothetical protein
MTQATQKPNDPLDRFCGTPQGCLRERAEWYGVNRQLLDFMGFRCPSISL